MKRKTLITAPLAVLLSLAWLPCPGAKALTLSSGSATITLSEGIADSISEFDSLFDAGTTRADALSLAAPGNAPFTEGASVLYSDPIRPFGVTPLNDAGGTTPGTPGASRTRQATTLDFTPGSVLGSWSTSNDAFGFTGNTVLGEQIGLTLMQRFTGPFSGALLYGDFALRYTGSKLMLTSNIDFLNAEWAEIGSPVVNYTGDSNGGTLTITGDLLIGEGLALLDGSAVVGTDFGNFSLTATVVPEPASGILLGSAAVALSALRRRRGAAR